MMNDFRVLYLAAEALTNCEKVYFQAFGLDTGYYKYSPFYLLVLAPFSYLPYIVVASIYFLINIFAAGLTIILSRKIWVAFTSNSKNTLAILFLTTLVAFSHLYRELYLGNTNLLLLLASLAVFNLLTKGKNKAAGMLLALIILAKPHFIILLPLLFLRRRYTTLIVMSGSLLLGLLIPAIFVGWNWNAELLWKWVEVMVYHNDYQIISANTVSQLSYHFLSYIPGIENGIIYQLSVIAIAGLFFLLFVAGNMRSNRKYSAEGTGYLNFAIEYFILVALIPSLLITDTQHFLLSIPLIALIIGYLFRGRNILLTIVACLAFILYVGTWGDLLGPWSGYIENSGSLGIGNLLIISIGIIIFYRFKKEQSVV